MSDNWVVQNLQNALETWNSKLAEIWSLVTTTPGNQHWVAITGVNGNNVNIVDPGSNGTDLWSSYEWSKSSQFNYFMVN